MLGVISAAAAAFVATNVDDLFVLMLLFGQAHGKTARLRVAAGQFLGIGLLTLASMAAALGLGRIPEQYLRLLGLVPILLGLRAWKNREEGGDHTSAAGVLSTALLTIANGGDNLGVYIPLFAGYTAGKLAATAAVFALLCGLWCLLGMKLASLPRIQDVIRRWKGILVPAVLILLGFSVILSV